LLLSELQRLHQRSSGSIAGRGPERRSVRIVERCVDMSAHGPSLHLVRRSDMSGVG